MINVQGKQVAVIGAGREGAVSAKWLAAHGATVTMADQQSVEQLGELHDSLQGIVSEWRLGDDYLQHLDGFELLVRSPGVRFLTPELQAAASRGIELTSQTKLFFDLCPATIVGVTGTKGKGTTAGLITAMLRAGGCLVHLGGNIGTPPLEFLDQVGAEDVVVLELSSFQLQDLTVSPQIAVITNVTADHLDHHADLNEYQRAKENLIAHQRNNDLAVLNADDAGSKQVSQRTSGRAAWFGLEEKPKKLASYVANDTVYIRTRAAEEVVCQTSEIAVPGPHNCRNVLAACIVANELGVSASEMHEAVLKYRGLPYHLEYVGEHAGVKYFNDSYATNPTATIPALQSFQQPIVLIAGGADKHLPYDTLADEIIRTVKALVLIPPTGEQIEQAVLAAAARHGVEPPRCVQIAEASEIVPAAAELAEPGDVVLLSPAAASFGLFSNYAQRGAYFTAQVAKLGE